MIQVPTGKCVLCIGVPAVTEKRLAQSRQVNRPGNVVMRDARLIDPHLGQTGPAGQRAFSRKARLAVGSEKRLCNA
jgi:hypothetical protein